MLERGPVTIIMRMNRRNVLVGLGTIVAGGGAALGTGAFSNVEAERDATINVANDSNAFLGLAPVTTGDRNSSNPYVSENSDGIIEFYFNGVGGDASGLNNDAVSKFDNVLEVSNNGELSVNISVTAIDDTGSGVTDIDSVLSIYEDTESISPLSSGATAEVGFEFDTTWENSDGSRDAENVINDIDQIQITAETTVDTSST
ncbi:hypothetical protein HYG81_08995 [Natrinema zhouii]|uniref:DUF1102 domain-containing protein n=1 Tax=Natrinema zhouii TaxID=1710539 RepID=A0A7D6GIC5_9EURY|nr:hypothetical protein [Natrinema zhouii]QLK24319.1 hypothetical protein HYG81_08995 [Natrinema zhouii]